MKALSLDQLREVRGGYTASAPAPTTAGPDSLIAVIIIAAVA